VGRAILPAAAFQAASYGRVKSTSRDVRH
jgi:hypothetical protein